MWNSLFILTNSKNLHFPASSFSFPSRHKDLFIISIAFHLKCSFHYMKATCQVSLCLCRLSVYVCVCVGHNHEHIYIWCFNSYFQYIQIYMVVHFLLSHFIPRCLFAWHVYSLLLCIIFGAIKYRPINRQWARK